MLSDTLRWTALAACSVAMLSGCAQLSSSPSVSQWNAVAPYGELVERPAGRFDRAWVSPDTDFGLYKGVILEAPELAFRTPDRFSQQFPLSDAQKSRLQSLLIDEFAAEFADLSKLQVTTAPGPDVLRLKVRVRDIVATLPPVTQGGPGGYSIALKALGEATLVLELRDAQSEETLAVAVDSRAVEGAAFLQNDGLVLGWSAAGEACAAWAKAARKGLEGLVVGR